MGRERPYRSGLTAPATVRRKLIKRDKPSYKVILEQVTQQKKKLITVGSFRAEPPPGYTFIPAGDPQITNRCKQLARLDGDRVYVVSTTKHRHHGLSNQVHRIGYHFPSSVVGRACTSLGIDLSRDGHVLYKQQNWAAEVSLKQRNGKKQKGQQDLPLKPGLSQATIDTQAREAIKDLFPNIPPKDLHDIVTHAFEVGKSRVGTASELSLPRRVQLAVVAHIRHTYTDYDKLLKQIPYQAARALIEQPSLDKLAQWRGDDEDEPDAMEEILREVIVIDDDDEETNTHSNGKAIHNSYGNHQGSVEIISSRAIGDNMETRPIDYGKSRSLVTGVESPESDDDQEVTFLGHGQYVFDKPDQARHNREGAHRLRAWEEARTRFRHPFDRPPPESSRVPPESLRHADGAFDEGNSRNISGLQLREYRQPNNQEAGYLNNLPLHRESAPNTTIPHGLILQTDHRNTISSKQLRPLPHAIPVASSGNRAADHNTYHEYHQYGHLPFRGSTQSRRIFLETARSDSDPVNSLRVSPTSIYRSDIQLFDSQRSTEHLPQPEKIVQSIENPAYTSLRHPCVRQVRRAIENDPPLSDRYIMHDQMRLRKVDQDFTEDLQLSKRRRVDPADFQVQDQYVVPNELQRSLLIPIGHDGQYCSPHTESLSTHPLNGQELSSRDQHQHNIHSLNRVIYSDPHSSRQLHLRPEGSDNVASFSTESPHHRQILISPRQLPSPTFSPTVPIEYVFEQSAPGADQQYAIRNVPHGVSASYVSLPREASHASYLVGSRSRRKEIESQAPKEATRNQLPDFRKTPIRESYPMYGNGLQQTGHDSRSEQLDYYDSVKRPVGARTERPGRMLSSERTIEQPRSAWESNRTLNVQGPAEDRSIRDPFQKSSKHPSESGVHHTVQQTRLHYNNLSFSDRHFLKYEPTRLPVPQDNRFLVQSQGPEHEQQQRIYSLQDPQRIEERSYRPITQLSGKGHEPRKIFDRHTGRELIILD